MRRLMEKTDRPRAAAALLPAAPEEEAARSAVVPGRDVEIHLQAYHAAGEDPAVQARGAYDNLFREVRRRGGRPADIVAEKIFFSDIAAQIDAVRAVRQEAYSAAGAALPAGACVQQPPARAGRLLELQACALLPEDGGRPAARALSGLPAGSSGVSVRLADHRRVYLANLAGGVAGDGLDVDGQAALMFRRAESCLAHERLAFRHVVRTWIYLPEIDGDYDLLNRARRNFFASRRIDPAPASTGIQGAVLPRDRGCGMDLLAIEGDSRVRTRVLSAPTMNEAPAYGSDFSRGLRVDFADRGILFVSGTASIDTDGSVAHPGDFVGQAGRMLANVKALLYAQGAGLGQIVSAITYLKRAADRPALDDALRRFSFPAAAPHTVVVAGVCRPGWLCEMEAIAVVP